MRNLVATQRYELIPQTTKSGAVRLLLFDSFSGQIWVSTDPFAEEPGNEERAEWTKLSLPADLRPPEPEKAAGNENAARGLMEQTERTTIVKILRECGGNKVEAAKRLGIGRQTLYNKINEYQIETREAWPTGIETSVFRKDFR